MAMETRVFDGKTFYPLKGFSGYYATVDGKVLSSKKGVRLLNITMQGTYHLYKDGKVVHITAAHIAYMAQNGCAFEEIPYKYCYIKDGKAYATDKYVKNVKPKIPRATALKRVEFMENEIGILRRFYTTQKVKEIRAYIESNAELLTGYAMRTLNKGVTKAKELVQEAISEFYISLYKGLVTYTILAYLKRIIRTMVSIEKKY